VPRKKKTFAECMNAGRPWSEIDLDNLRSQLKLGTPLTGVAELLDREPLQVQTKVEQLAAGYQYEPRRGGHRTPLVASEKWDLSGQPASIRHDQFKSRPEGAATKAHRARR
jgi:hypothetical protein